MQIEINQAVQFETQERVNQDPLSQTPHDGLADGKVAAGGGVGGTGRSGSVLKFMDELFERRNIPWEHVEISDRSHEFSPNSSFTACVHEIAIGNADMCWGNFWTLPVRRQLMVSFTGSLYAFVVSTNFVSPLTSSWCSRSTGCSLASRC